MKDPGERVAIVSMAGRFPGAATLSAFWKNVSAGVDASREIPMDRWTIPPEQAYEARLAQPDRVCSLRGYFLDPFTPDLRGMKIEPSMAAELDVMYQLALDVGGQAFRAAHG